MTGTGGGTSIRHEDKIYIAPSGVQKELMKPTDMFVMDFHSREYLRRIDDTLAPHEGRFLVHVTEPGRPQGD